ncbi:hypothetical protein [Dokdonella sp.]|uniref:hypothetical protein n=1 Tax=Dokdonella sp. TaxID=2291710 RepID=UPI002DD68642|nr:hypothetical protein [Dokdonella sp.]
MRLSNLFFATAFVLMCVSVHAVASVSKNLVLTFSGENVSYSYGEAPWKDDFLGIDIYICDKAKEDEDDPCTLVQNSPKMPNSQGSIAGDGLYRLEFYTPEKEFFGDKIKKAVRYSQYIAVLPQSTSYIADVASRYAPKFSFHSNENFFPVSINDLFKRNYSDLGFATFQDGYRGVESSDSLAEVLSNNGSSENKINLKTDVAKGIKGNRGDFNVYWYHQTSGNDLWVTYFTLYGFDEKRDEYLNGGVLSSLGSHTVDRESVTIKFTHDGTSYVPKQVIYAGHLDKQPTTFLGCGSSLTDFFDCAVKGTLGIRWFNGSTTVDWENVSRVESSPIVYVAHGSHANTPAYGWYYIETGSFEIATNVTEPAGNSISNNLSSGNLISLDFSKPEFAPLTYSGYIIKSKTSKWYRIFPFVRFPTSQWALSSNKTFNECVSANAGCEKYIARALPTATGVSPAFAAVGIVTQFTIFGENLPTSKNLDITFNGCANISFGTRSASSHTFTCTPTAAGAISAVVRDYPSMTVLGAFGVMVTAANPVCVAPQVLQGGACVTPAGQTTMSNDFSASQDIQGWIFTLPWNSTYKTTDYSLANGSLELRMDQTDKGGWALSSSFQSSDKLKVSVSHYMDGGAYFFPSIMLTNDGAAPENIVEGVAFKNIQVGFVRSYYGPDYACSAYDIPRVIDNLGCVASSKTSATTSSSLFNKWITTVIVYDSISGALTVDYENDGVADFFGKIAVENRFKVSRLAFGTFGWHTGHLHRIDSVKVESIN